MSDVVRAHMEVRGFPVLTSNQCHAIAMNLNCQIGSTTDYDEAKERELFTAFAMESFLSVHRGEGRDYFYAETEAAWLGWKACAKSRARSAE